MIIDLCLSLFPWAEFRKHKGALTSHHAAFTVLLLCAIAS
jgi:hypothetical protein